MAEKSDLLLNYNLIGFTILPTGGASSLNTIRWILKHAPNSPHSWLGATIKGTGFRIHTKFVRMQDKIMHLSIEL